MSCRPLLAGIQLHVARMLQPQRASAKGFVLSLLLTARQHLVLSLTVVNLGLMRSVSTDQELPFTQVQHGFMTCC